MGRKIDAIKEYCEENKIAVIGGAIIGASSAAMAYYAYVVGCRQGSLNMLNWLNENFPEMDLKSKLTTFFIDKMIK